MARPKSEEKRKILLSAAAKVFARNGLSASTASITSEAKMAEGTLFIYFKGKDDLINELYLEIKQDLAASILAGYPQQGSIRKRTKHIWKQYVNWGMEHPEEFNVVSKIKIWDGLRAETKEAASAGFRELEAVIEGGMKDGTFLKLPHDFLFAILSALAETTMAFMRHNPKESEKYQEHGFDIFWNGITIKK